MLLPRTALPKLEEEMGLAGEAVPNQPDLVFRRGVQSERVGRRRLADPSSVDVQQQPVLPFYLHLYLFSNITICLSIDAAIR